MTQASDIPNYSPKVFAQDATGTYVRNVPQTTGDPAAASMSLGFPPQTFTDEGAGGTPPDGRDINGILKFLAAWAQWVGLGGPVPYNAAVSSAGGYPKGARVQSATSLRIWLCTVDNNTTNPDSGGAGWVSDVSVTYQDFTASASGNVTVPAWASHAEVYVVGGGGGGGGGNATLAGGGGGSGGLGFGVISVVPGAVMPYAVGAGGTGGGVNGGNGGQSTFAGITATGGSGALSSSGGFGGTTTGAPRNFTGNDGGDGNPFTTAKVVGGNGAAGPFGGAGRAGDPTGHAAQAAGAGGGGAWGNPSGVGLGGDGRAGAVLIRWLP